MHARDGAYTFVRVRGGNEGYEVWREGVKISTFYGTLEKAQACYREQQRRDRRVARALRSRKPGDLCRLGWHRLANGRLWFRFAVGEEGRMLVYRVGLEPFEHRCRTIWCHGEDATPWVCRVCGEKIATDRSLGSVRPATPSP